MPLRADVLRKKLPSNEEATECLRYLPRLLERQVVRATKAFPAIVLIGPRRAGKTWLLKHLFPRTEYFQPESSHHRARRWRRAGRGA